MRGKFVFGLTDDGLKERLLRESDLSLEHAVALAQWSESSKIQVKAMASRSTHAFNCDELQQNKYPQPRLSPCGQCGKRHKPRHCPAYGQQCSACHKLHHLPQCAETNWVLPTPCLKNLKRGFIQLKATAHQHIQIYHQRMNQPYLLIHWKFMTWHTTQPGCPQWPQQMVTLLASWTLTQKQVYCQYLLTISYQ